MPSGSVSSQATRIRNLVPIRLRPDATHAAATRPSPHSLSLLSRLPTSTKGRTGGTQMSKQPRSRRAAARKPRGPLAGIRVVDMTTVLMGPYATQILADYGADVIKVEPLEGDIMRHAGPMRNPRMGPMFFQANRNKRSVVVDIKTKGGRDVLLRLCARADVFICNVRPAALRRRRLGPE